MSNPPTITATVTITATLDPSKLPPGSRGEARLMLHADITAVAATVETCLRARVDPVIDHVVVTEYPDSPKADSQ